MAQSGWFPDPGGQPGMFRYWDGNAWTQQLSSQPQSAPGGPHSGGGKNNKALLIGAVAAVVVLALVAFFMLPRVFGSSPTPSQGPETDGPSPTVSSWDETSTPTPPPSPRTAPPRTSLPCPDFTTGVRDGRLYGGRLSVQTIPDASWTVNAVRTIPWGICATGLEKKIATNWVSEVILAGIQPDELTSDLESQVDMIAEDAEDRFYSRGTTSVKRLDSKPGTIQGSPSWHLRMDVRTDEYGPRIPGDVVDIVVVQHEDGSRSAMMSFATIGDTTTQGQVDAARNSVRLEP